MLNRRFIYVGNRKQGPSRSALYARVVTFCLQRLAQVGVQKADFVLNGDSIDVLELFARGTNLSDKHSAFFAVAQALRAMGHDVYYLRGNHDFIAPPGPWSAVGDVYANAGLTTIAEHGDRHDRLNWPRGLANSGSGLVMKVAPLETYFTILGPGRGVYDLAGIDNIKPLTARTVRWFLQARLRNRVVRNQVLPLLAFLAGLGGFNNADDRAGYRGALRLRAGGRFRDWLTVQGHTHVPIAVPKVHYNTGTWIATLLRPGSRREILLEVLPFLIVYKDPKTGQRVEEYYTLNVTRRKVFFVKRNNQGINNLRRTMGFRPVP